MARASFNTLPLELKAKVVEMTSDQEDAFRARVIDPADRVEHVNSLSALALGNKELRQLAARHQFKVFLAHRSSMPIFRFVIFPRYGHHITEIMFNKTDKAGQEAADYTISIMGQLPALRALRFEHKAAMDLFGPAVTLGRDLKDLNASYRAEAISFVGPRISSLVLDHFPPSQVVALVRACPNLRLLGLLDLRNPATDQEYDEMAEAMATLRHLSSLSVSLGAASNKRWPMEAFKSLERNPPPIRCLQLFRFPFDNHTIHFISNFAPTVRILSVMVLGTPLDLAAIPPVQLPLLTQLRISTPLQDQLPTLTRLFHPISFPTLTHFASVHQTAVDLADPALLSFVSSQPALRHLSLHGFTAVLPFNQIKPRADVLTPPSSLTAYADLVRSRGLDSSVLDRPHLTAYHPKAELSSTESSVPFITQTLHRTLDFGKIELDRMAAEGNVVRAVAWISKLKALEDERLAWKD
ncbi:hypothetical protein RQP46_010522 [Phenoliferia psychrophenolica]